MSAVSTTIHRARVTSLVLQVALGIWIASTLVEHVLRPILGPTLLGIATGPFWGWPGSIDATITEETWLTGTPPSDLPGMLVGGPFERGEYVETTGPTGITIAIHQPMTFRQFVGVAGAEILMGLVVVIALTLALLIVRDLRGGQLFAPGTLRRTYVIAAVVGIGGTLAEIAGAWGRVGILRGPVVAGLVEVDWSVSFAPLYIGLGIAAATEVVRQGIRMRHDVEGLV